MERNILPDSKSTFLLMLLTFIAFFVTQMTLFSMYILRRRFPLEIV